ncbi:MAG: glycosyltransferase [Bacteroidetes bacterium]|nr:glycosyltransferase [Bacteroidota bacterium]
MRILITSDPEIAVPPLLYGGAERLVSDLIDEFESQGHECFLLSKKGSTHSKVKQHFSYKSDFSQGLTNVIQNSVSFRKAYTSCKPDFVLCFSRILYVYLTALLHQKSIFIKRYGRPISTKSTGLAKKIIGNRIQFVAAANHMLKHIENKSEWEVLFNFVDLEFYCDSEVPKEHLFFLGRIEDIKGVYEAIQVANNLNEKLIIAGNVEDDKRDYFEEFVKPFLNERIQYVGPVNNIQKKTYLQTAKATLFPIKWEEPFGIVMAESMACGTPVIAFKRGSVPEVVLDGISGFICENVEGMTNKIQDLNQLDRIKVREWAETNFNRKNAAQRYVDLAVKLKSK